jgi:putative transposase
MALGIVKSEHEEKQKTPSPFSWISESKVIEKKSSHSLYYSSFDLRNLIVPKVINSTREWLLETPFQLRAYSVFEFHDRYKTCIENLKNKNIKHFDMKYKTKKSFRWTMDIPKDNIYISSSDTCKTHCIKDYQGNVLEENVSSQRCSTCKYLRQDQFMLYRESGWIKTTEKVPSSITEYDSKIHFDGVHYYILVPYTKTKLRTTSKDDWFCSLDPGSRKFQTVYSPVSNEIVNIGTDASSKMLVHLEKLDQIISKETKGPLKKYKIKKIKLLNKIKNLQQELRNKTSRFLCENYNCIVAPKLTKENDIIKKENRKINSKTVRKMVVLAHSKFIELLKTKACEYTNVKVFDATEEYTSQVCLRCKHKTKTSEEIYKCKKCSFVCDRDTLGSINILLKHWGLML